MNEKERKKHIREPPSIPFIWETKPGIPIKDWKPMVSSVNQTPKTPLKLIASVPFVWEEKPGIPLHNFSHVSLDDYILPKPKNTTLISDQSDSITSLELESFNFDNDVSFNSAPSLFTNCIETSTKLSTTIPLQQNSLSKNTCDNIYIPSSPVSSETDSSISSYATGMSSPTGSAFLECLFPLFPPKSGFLERDVGYTEKVALSSVEVKVKDFEYEDNMCDMSKKAPTLGELIMMSRRRSCRRKATQMNKWDPPKKTSRKQAFGCFRIVTNRSVIEGLMKRKFYPRLKLV